MADFNDKMNEMMGKMMEGMLEKMMESVMTSMFNAMSSAIEPPKSQSKLSAYGDEKPKDYKPVAAKIGIPYFEENFSSVYVEELPEGGKIYRGYSHCPIGGAKGKSIKDGIKAGFKAYDAVWTGQAGDDAEVIDLQWTFPSKKKADAYIKWRKEVDKMKHEKE